MDGGAWWAAVHGVAKSRTRLSDFTFTFHFHTLEKEMATHSSVLAQRIPGTGEPGGLPSMGSHRVGHDWSDLAAHKRDVKMSFSHQLKIRLEKVLILIMFQPWIPNGNYYSKRIIWGHMKETVWLSELSSLSMTMCETGSQVSVPE